jgi:hypothetical protein
VFDSSEDFAGDFFRVPVVAAGEQRAQASGLGADFSRWHAGVTPPAGHDMLADFAPATKPSTHLDTSGVPKVLQMDRRVHVVQDMYATCVHITHEMRQ